MKKNNRQRNTTYFMPIKEDLTRFYMKLKSKLSFYGWQIRSKYKKYALSYFHNFFSQQQKLINKS